jgi:hypothetical protein
MVYNDSLRMAIAELATKSDQELATLIGLHLDGHEVCIYFMALLMQVRKRANERGDDSFKDLMRAPPCTYLTTH